MKPCKCHAEVPGATHRAWIATGGVGVYSPGIGYADAVARVKEHARRDGLKRSSWVGLWVECLGCGSEVDASERCACKVTA